MELGKIELIDGEESSTFWIMIEYIKTQFSPKKVFPTAQMHQVQRVVGGMDPTSQPIVLGLP